jgi:hypothetical protein
LVIFEHYFAGEFLFFLIILVQKSEQLTNEDHQMKNNWLYFFIGLILLSTTENSISQNKDLFSEFKQILPRGGIPAVINPVYVTAEEASINDNTWILGVLINDQARAYSLNLLNHHEVVNDVIDTTAFAAVW